MWAIRLSSSSACERKSANLVQVVGTAGDVDEIGKAFERIVDLMGDRGGEASGGGEFFGAHEGAFGHAAFGDVAEDEDDANHLAGAVADGSAAVVDADLFAFSGDEEGVVGKADDGAEAAHLVDGIFDSLAGLFVEDGEDFVEGFAASFVFVPAGKLLGDEVHEDDVAIGVAGDDRVADAADGGVEPLLAGVRLFALQLDLLDLAVVGGGQFMEDSLRVSQTSRAATKATSPMRAILAYAVDLSIFGKMVSAASGNNPGELIHLGPHGVHLLLALEHMLLHAFRIFRRRVDLPIGFLLPLLLAGLKPSQAVDLVGALDQIEQSVELGINLMVGLAQRLEKSWIADE